MLNAFKNFVGNQKIVSLPKGGENMGANTEFNREKCEIFPRTIRELLKRLVEQWVTIILDAEEGPERVEVEAVVGDLLVAETVNHKFKFVDIKCICAVIVDREDLLESIFGREFDEREHENEKHEHECEKNEHESERSRMVASRFN